MSKLYLTPIRLVNLESDPMGHKGDIYFNSFDNSPKYFDGTSWQSFGSSSNGNILIDGGGASSSFVSDLDGGGA
jgi:hypothetical protein